MRPDKPKFLDHSARNAYNNTAELEEDMRPIIHCPKHGISKTQKQWGTDTNVCSRCVDDEMTAFAKQSTSDVSKRAKILDTAKQYVTKDRNASHGEPEDTFGVIAGLWSAYLGAEVNPVDVSMLMSLMKIARIKSNQKHLDSFVDLCGYAACGGEISSMQHGQEI